MEMFEGPACQWRRLLTDFIHPFLMQLEFHECFIRSPKRKSSEIIKCIINATNHEIYESCRSRNEAERGVRRVKDPWSMQYTDTNVAIVTDYIVYLLL